MPTRQPCPSLITAALLAAAVSVPAASLAQCPLAPQPVIVPSAAPCTVRLVWPQVASATSYVIFRSAVPGVLGSSIATVTVLPDTSPDFTDVGVPPGAAYYTVRSRGASTPSCPMGLGADSPQIPTMVPFQAVGNMGPLVFMPACNGFDVAWNAVSGAATYDWRVQTQATPPATVDEGTATGTSAQIRLSSPQPGPYTVSVTPRNACGSGMAAAISVTTLNGPGVPAGSVSAEATPEGGVRLSWPPVMGATGYAITRRSSSGSAASLGTITNTWTLDPTPTPGDSVTYCVRAVHACGPTGGINQFCTATATITPPNAIVFAPPAIEKRLVGQTAVLSVRAANTLDGSPGMLPLSFRWRRLGMPLSDGGRISGATTPTLTITGLTLADQDTYDVVITQPALVGAAPIVVPAALLVSNPCRVDFNDNAARDIDDIFLYLNAWFAGCP